MGHQEEIQGQEAMGLSLNSMRKKKKFPEVLEKPPIIEWNY
jgi:hypothetical protein